MPFSVIIPGILFIFFGFVYAITNKSWAKVVTIIFALIAINNSVNMLLNSFRVIFN